MGTIVLDKAHLLNTGYREPICNIFEEFKRATGFYNPKTEKIVFPYHDDQTYTTLRYFRLERDSIVTLQDSKDKITFNQNYLYPVLDLGKISWNPTSTGNRFNIPTQTLGVTSGRVTDPMRHLIGKLGTDVIDIESGSDRASSRESVWDVISILRFLYIYCGWWDFGDNENYLIAQGVADILGTSRLGLNDTLKFVNPTLFDNDTLVTETKQQRSYTTHVDGLPFSLHRICLDKAKLLNNLGTEIIEEKTKKIYPYLGRGSTIGRRSLKEALTNACLGENRFRVRGEDVSDLCEYSHAGLSLRLNLGIYPPTPYFGTKLLDQADQEVSLEKWLLNDIPTSYDNPQLTITTTERNVEMMYCESGFYLVQTRSSDTESRVFTIGGYPYRSKTDKPTYVNAAFKTYRYREGTTEEYGGTDQCYCYAIDKTGCSVVDHFSQRVNNGTFEVEVNNGTHPHRPAGHVDVSTLRYRLGIFPKQWLNGLRDEERGTYKHLVLQPEHIFMSSNGWLASVYQDRQPTSKFNIPLGRWNKTSIAQVDTGFESVHGEHLFALLNYGPHIYSPMGEVVCRRVNEKYGYLNLPPVGLLIDKTKYPKVFTALPTTVSVPTDARATGKNAFETTIAKTDFSKVISNQKDRLVYLGSHSPYRFISDVENTEDFVKQTTDGLSLPQHFTDETGYQYDTPFSSLTYAQLIGLFSRENYHAIQSIDKARTNKKTLLARTVPMQMINGNWRQLWTDLPAENDRQEAVRRSTVTSDDRGYGWNRLSPIVKPIDVEPITKFSELTYMYGQLSVYNDATKVYPLKDEPLAYHRSSPSYGYQTSSLRKDRLMRPLFPNWTHVGIDPEGWSKTDGTPERKFILTKEEFNEIDYSPELFRTDTTYKTRQLNELEGSERTRPERGLTSIILRYNRELFLKRLDGTFVMSRFNKGVREMLNTLIRVSAEGSYCLIPEGNITVQVIGVDSNKQPNQWYFFPEGSQTTGATLYLFKLRADKLPKLIDAIQFSTLTRGEVKIENDQLVSVNNDSSMDEFHRFGDDELFLNEKMGYIRAAIGSNWFYSFLQSGKPDLLQNRAGYFEARLEFKDQTSFYQLWNPSDGTENTLDLGATKIVQPTIYKHPVNPLTRVASGCLPTAEELKYRYLPTVIRGVELGLVLPKSNSTLNAKIIPADLYIDPSFALRFFRPTGCAGQVKWNIEEGQSPLGGAMYFYNRWVGGQALSYTRNNGRNSHSFRYNGTVNNTDTETLAEEDWMTLPMVNEAGNGYLISSNTSLLNPTGIPYGIYPVLQPEQNQAWTIDINDYLGSSNTYLRFWRGKTNVSESDIKSGIKALLTRLRGNQYPVNPILKGKHIKVLEAADLSGQLIPTTGLTDIVELSFQGTGKFSFKAEQPFDLETYQYAVKGIYTKDTQSLFDGSYFTIIGNNKTAVLKLQDFALRRLDLNTIGSIIRLIGNNNTLILKVEQQEGYVDTTSVTRAPTAYGQGMSLLSIYGENNTIWINHPNQRVYNIRATSSRENKNVFNDVHFIEPSHALTNTIVMSVNTNDSRCAYVDHYFTKDGKEDRENAKCGFSNVQTENTNYIKWSSVK